MNEKIDAPIYAKIALDMAGRIYRGEFKEGEKIHGRSMLAGEYQVSPETIRRAMNLLEDMDIIRVYQGSGIMVNSRKNASKYIENFQNKESIHTLRMEMHKLLEQKREIESQILDINEKIIDYANRLKHSNPIQPIEIDIFPDCRWIGKTVSETKFWQNTGATIVGIRRGGSIILSPGPYAAFEKDDTLLVIGDGGVVERVKNFMQE